MEQNFNDELNIANALDLIAEKTAKTHYATGSLNLHEMTKDTSQCIKSLVGRLQEIQTILIESQTIDFKGEAQENLLHAFRRIEEVVFPYDPILEEEKGE